MSIIIQSIWLALCLYLSAKSGSEIRSFNPCSLLYLCVDLSEIYLSCYLHVAYDLWPSLFGVHKQLLPYFFVFLVVLVVSFVLTF